MSYVYKQTERQLWTVGFYDPKGKWHSESDHDSADGAADRTAWLNGSSIQLFSAEAIEVEETHELSETRAKLKAAYAENARLAALINETEHS